MKLWIDDERKAPDDTWAVAKSSAEAIQVLAGKRNIDRSLRQETIIEVLALDHDLGYSEEVPRSYGLTEDYPYPALEYMEHEHIYPRVITVHSSNPWGRKNLLAYCAEHFPESEVLSYVYPHDYDGLSA